MNKESPDFNYSYNLEERKYERLIEKIKSYVNNNTYSNETMANFTEKNEIYS